MSLDFDDRLVGNPQTRVVHSGVITALLDTLCGLVVMTKLPEGTPLATLDLRIDYLRPATPGKSIHATAECYKVTANVAFVRGAAFNAGPEDTIAHCTGTFMLGGAGFSANPGVGRGAYRRQEASRAEIRGRTERSGRPASNQRYRAVRPYGRP